MATYATFVQAARMQASIASIDAQANPGRLVLMTQNETAVCTLTLSKPCGTVVTSGSNVAILLTTPVSGTAVSAGTVTKAMITDGSGLPIVTGLVVGMQTGDVILSNNLVATGALITVDNAVIQHG